MKYFIIGGAGFIGSHFADEVDEVIIYDNFSTGRKEFLKPNVKVVKGDILDTKRLEEAMKGCDIVCHFAANADVRSGIKDTSIDLEQNTIGTHNVLEAMRKNEIKEILFASTAVVYGEPEKFPTPENIELIQTSTYGASKVAAESLIQAYCEYFGMKSWIFRFTSFIGERYSHGVIFDFIKKLEKNPKELEILGDGNQEKSYLYVKDGIKAMLKAYEKSKNKVNIFNLGHENFLKVTKMADIICDELNVKPEYKFTGGKRGWIGDSPKVHLDITKMKKLGWKPEMSIEEGTRITVKYLMKNPTLLKRN